MDSLLVLISGFLACTVVIIYSGSRLSVYGDKIAELTGMGRAWVGLILMASVTSLPELITGISSVAIVKQPDLAAGDIFGSCVFNLLILSVLDARIRKPLLSSVRSSHIVAAIFSIILLAVSGLGIFLSDVAPVFLWISSFTFLIIGIYLAAVYGIFRYEQMDMAAKIEASDAGMPPANPEELKKVVWGYSINALIVVGGALFLPYFGEQIAAKTGLSNSFFGTLFMAAATSLPELVVSLTAMKVGALDMAVGNLLGSNVFNMLILGLDDIFYAEGSIFSAISDGHLFSIIITIIMTAVVGLGLLFKPRKKQVWLFSLDTFILLLLYAGLMAFLLFNNS